MSVSHAKVTVTMTAGSLLAGVSYDGANGGEGSISRSIVLTNEGAVTVYIGGKTVSSASYGYKLLAGANLPLDLVFGDVPYGVTASSTADVRVLHMGV